MENQLSDIEEVKKLRFEPYAYKFGLGNAYSELKILFEKLLKEPLKTS